MIDDSNIEICQRLFRGREDYFAQQGEYRYFPVPKALDEFYLRRHLEGDVTFGIYVLNQSSCCNLICVDIDIPKNDLSEVDFTNPKMKHGHLRYKLNVVIEALSGQLAVPPQSILLEDTGGRGYHIWVFFSEAMQGQTAVAFGEVLKTQLDFEIEFFPKQGRLTPNRKLGNLIKLPLGLHRKYGSWSYFFSLSAEEPQLISGIEENIMHLQTILPVAPEVVNRAANAFAKELHLSNEAPAPISEFTQKRPQFEGDPVMLISQCTAMRDIRMKAERGSSLSRSEAFHFADVMLSVPGGTDTIHDTMRLSLAEDYDRIRTHDEIERIIPLHLPRCFTLVREGVCSGYCKDSVRKRNEDPLVAGTTPCSVWLRRVPAKPVIDTDNLCERIGTAENLRRSFFKLKQYHEHEDALFFDPFDFEHFEYRLDANCGILAKVLLEQSEMPFLGYMSVPLPKKLNEAQELVYRRMSYSSVYDQVPIQAIFNFVAPIVENEFQNTSYGYRWNMDTDSPYSIFEDWRKAYRRFRNDIMAALKRHPNGFHVCCDIKGYYDHVDQSILLEQLRKLVPDEYVYRMIERTVRAYASTEQGGRGLPQGPAFARLLANLYLNAFDIFADKVSKAYFRYVDDVVLVFESEREAEQGLEQIVHRLLDLALELSQDEAKKAVVEVNTDVSRVRKTLDKIHYGILEGARHVEHLAPEAVSDFLDAVERHSVSPVTYEQLIKINDILPSLLYVVSREALFPHLLKPKVLDIVGFLTQHRWFFPKRLKTIFYRLLDLESDEERLREFFLPMEPTHKVYFLLSVFGSWQSHGKHRQLLERLVYDAIGDDNVYVWGFAVSIAAKLEVDIDISFEHQGLMQKLAKADGLFGILKWLPTIDYLTQSVDERASIRDLVGPWSPDLPKMFLLSNITRLPTVYVDGVYLDGLLQNSGVLLLPAACALLAVATDKGEFFDSLLKFVLSRLAFKPLVVSLVTKGIFDKRAASGFAEISNLKSLYEHVLDNELRRSMLGSVSRIMQYGLACDEEFAKRHREIDRYNECFLFQMLDEGEQYNYLELIPEGTLRGYIQRDLDTFRAIMDDFGAKEILPDSNVFYDSGKGEMRLAFRMGESYCVLDPSEFSLNPESVRRACILSAEVYRKACYFRHHTGKAPHICPANLLIDKVTGSVMFSTIGRSLCAPHVFAGTTVGDEETDIAKMISILLEGLIFNNGSEVGEFMEENTHTGLYAFLALFIKNMSNREPGHRYSCSRFVYLVDQLKRGSEQGLTQNWLAVVYLRERLKGALFRCNSETITWHGIFQAVNEHLSTHIRAVCSLKVLRAFPFHYRLPFSGRGKRHYHTLSRHLLELSLSRKDLRDEEKDNAPYLDLVEFLLIYSSICVEIVALVRTLRRTLFLQRLSSSALLSQNRIQVRAGGYEIDVAASDIAGAVIWQPKDKADETITGLTLCQLSLQALFTCEFGFEDDFVDVKKPERMRDEVFRKFAHACLVRIPGLEVTVEKELQRVFMALRSNEDFTRLEGLKEMHNAVAILSQDLRQVRKGLRLSRQHGRADGRYFPPDVRCRSSFHRSCRVREHAFPGCALTNSFPSSRDGYVSSWDLRGTTVTNLMIPSEGINSLMQDLRKGRFLGFKLSYLYSGKMMLFWDGAAFIVNALVLAICDHLKSSSAISAGLKGICSVSVTLLGPLAIALFLKLILHDMGHWVPWYRQVITYIRKACSGEKGA